MSNSLVTDSSLLLLSIPSVFRNAYLCTPYWTAGHFPGWNARPRGFSPHRQRWYRPDDVVYSSDGCKALANTDPAEVITNPVSHE